MGRANAIRPYNNLLIQNEDVLSNPENPENPNSKPSCKHPKTPAETSPPNLREIQKSLKSVIQILYLPVKLYWNLSGKRREASRLYK